MKRIIIALLFCAAAMLPASAGEKLILFGNAPGIPYVAPGANNNVLTSTGTAWVSGAPVATGTIGSGVLDQLPYYSGTGVVLGATTPGGDCTFAHPNFTCTKTNGVVFGTAATVNTGTSGATIPLLNGNNTFSGNDTFSGSVTLNGALSGTGLTNYLASPAAIGGTAAAAGHFTTLGATGLLSTVASATGGAGVNFPPGTAPTSPNNGDVWTTSAGIYVQINGSTIGPLGTGGGGSVTWPTSGDLVLSNGTSSPAGLAPVNGDCPVGAGGIWTVTTCPGGSSVSVTAADPTVKITPSPGTGTFTVGTQVQIDSTTCVNPGGNACTITSADMGELVQVSSSTGIVAVTLPQAGTTGFEATKSLQILDTGTFQAVVTPTSSTIGGNASVTLSSATMSCPVSDATANWTDQCSLGATGQTTITAHSGGGQGSATKLHAIVNNVTTVAAGADSVVLDPSFPGALQIVTNNGASAMQVFGTSPDTVNGVATGTGVSQAVGVTTIYTSPAAGLWNATLLTNSASPPTGANPTATAGAAAVNGSAATFMRSDAAPAVQAASTSTAGIAKLNNAPVSVGWIAGVNPNNATIAVINQASTISAIIGDVETAAGFAATVSVYIAASGTACSGGTVVHSGSFNANGTAATNQTLTVTTTAVPAGDRICLQTTGTTSWTSGTGIGGITVFLAPS